MAFNSVFFILAFVGFYLLYSLFAKNAFLRCVLLLAFGLIFYFMLSGAGIIVLILLAISDFTIARAIYKSKIQWQKNVLLYASLIINIFLILCFRHFTDWFHLNDYLHWPMVIGVSFFVFRSMGYVLDVHRETITQPEFNFIYYLTYLSYFPLILAGPITPARQFIPELKAPFSGTAVLLNKALFLISSGIIKKFILSNYLAANFVDRVFESPSYFSGLENLMAVFGQAMVVYLDFSGYTDLMIGISLLLGFQIAENFNFPYLATNITEYWRRWHMSLSAWLNEYLFFPLNFALRTMGKTGIILALFVTFMVSGFWHGTAFHYTFWGLLHAVALAWDVITLKYRDTIKTVIPKSIYRGISILITFSFLCFSGIFFEARDINTGWVMIKKIFNQMDFGLFTKWVQIYPWIFVVIIVALFWQWLMEKPYQLLMQGLNRIPTLLLSIALVAVIFMAYQASRMGALPFIYLEF